MNIREIMARDVRTVERRAGVAEVARAALDSGAGGVPVVENGALLGLVTDTDLVTKHVHVHMPTFIGILGTVIPFERRGTDEEIRRVLAVTAGDLMETDVETIEADATVEDAATLMVEKGANPIPILEGRNYVGVVSRRDLIRLLLLEEEGSEPSGGG